MVDGWRRQTVGEIIRIASGQVDPKDENIGKKVSVGPENLRTGGGIEKRALQTARALSQISGKYAFDREAILYSKIRPNLNKVGLPDFDGICSADVYPMWIKATDIADRRFVYFLLTSERFVADASSRSFRTGLPKINRSDLESIVLDLPPLSEQRKIAEILQTWDEAIEKLQALRMAKRRIRNQVLTKILENPAWPLIPLSDIGEISGAGVDKKTIPGEEPVRLVNFLDVLQRDFLFDVEITHRVTAPARQMKRCDVRRGDVFFTPSSETQDEIACSAVAMEDMPATVYSYHILRLRFLKEVDLHFRAYLFKSSHFLKQAFRLCAGSGQRYVLSQDQFRRMTIFLPSLEEQRVIGNCVWAMDQEIALIGRKIEILTHQKRGLMQKLLNGEWRVVHTQPFPLTDNRKDACSD